MPQASSKGRLDVFVERARGRPQPRASGLAIGGACRGRRRRVIGPRLEVAIGEGAANRGERVRRAVEHGHAGKREFERERVVANLRVIGRDDDELVRGARRGKRRIGEAAMQIVAVANVGAEQAERGVADRREGRRGNE